MKFPNSLDPEARGLSDSGGVNAFYRQIPEVV